MQDVLRSVARIVCRVTFAGALFSACTRVDRGERVERVSRADVGAPDSVAAARHPGVRATIDASAAAARLLEKRGEVCFDERGYLSLRRAIASAGPWLRATVPRAAEELLGPLRASDEGAGV